MSDSTPFNPDPVTKPTLLLPGMIQRPDPLPEVTVVACPPEDLYHMMQSIIQNRPIIAQFLDNFTPHDLLGFVGWISGLIHNQTPYLWSALQDAVEVGKDVAIVLREQLQRECNNPVILPADKLTLIWPTGMVLNQFVVNQAVEDLDTKAPS